MTIHAFVFLSTHAHFQVSLSSAGQLTPFMGCQIVGDDEPPGLNPGAAPPLTDELVEFLDRDLGGANDAPKRSAVDLVMERHCDGRSSGAHEPHLAAFLRKHGVADLGQSSDAGRSGNDGKWRHTQAAKTLMSTTSYS
jgi:hypothetical protein